MNSPEISDACLVAVQHLAKGDSAAIAAQAAGMRSEKKLESTLVKELGVTPQMLVSAFTKGTYSFHYGASFHLEQTLAYLGRDSQNAAERTQANQYSRFFAIGDVGEKNVFVKLTLESAQCHVETSPLHNPKDWLRLHETLRRFLGLHQPLEAFHALAEKHAMMAPLAAALPGVRIPQVPTLWEALCWAVLGQQINLTFAYKLRNRLIRLANGIEAEGSVLSAPLPFPTPEKVLHLNGDTLRQHQFSRQKIIYVGEVARACIEGGLRNLSLQQASPDEAEARMLAVKGIGRWSAAYGLMRGLGYMDALPVGDAGLRNALRRFCQLDVVPDISQQEELTTPFRPYRSLATYYLWKSLGTPTDG